MPTLVQVLQVTSGRFVTCNTSWFARSASWSPMMAAMLSVPLLVVMIAVALFAARTAWMRYGSGGFRLARALAIGIAAAILVAFVYYVIGGGN